MSEVKLDFGSLKPIQEDLLDSVRTISELEPWISNISLMLDDNLMGQSAGVGGNIEGTILKYVLWSLYLSETAEDERIVKALIKRIKETLEVTDGPLPALEFRKGTLGWGFYQHCNRRLNKIGEGRLELLR